MSPVYAVIGGSGLYSLGDGFVVESSEPMETPYGTTSAAIIRGNWKNQPVMFLARHGESHHIPPHLVNYRANLYALKQQGVSHIIAVNAVGGITDGFSPQTIALPDQIIDYSWGRAHTFSDMGLAGLENGTVQHIDFTYPYSSELRAMIIRASSKAGIKIQPGGVYACTNGPRLETKAEVIKISRDGCNMIGMTGMPEAALARELGIEYASVALVVNWCAGITNSEITMAEIMRILELGMQPVKDLIFLTLTNQD